MENNDNKITGFKTMCITPSKQKGSYYFQFDDDEPICIGTVFNENENFVITLNPDSKTTLTITNSDNTKKFKLFFKTESKETIN